VPDLARVMGEAYPELPASAQRVSEVLRQEEVRFAETLENGMEVLEGALHREDRMLDGGTVFKLYDTFGFPVDLTADIARERGVQVDFAGFEAAMEKQRERARAASKFQMQSAVEYSGQATEFHGYDTLKLPARVVALYREGSAAERLETGERGIVVLDRTPFYAESGGQVGDRGVLVTSASPFATFRVEDTQKIQAEVFGHHGTMAKGEMKVGDAVSAQVDLRLRQATMYNHSATHLMHAALRKVLGNHVQQKGSLVDEFKTRFDFSHPKPVTPEEIAEVERLVNEQIRNNVQVEARVLKYDDAIRAGAIALFGEKYGDEVRVLGMGDFSTELCGGTHVKRSGDIGFFKIVSESGVASGVRRVEAVTGQAALEHVQRRELKLGEIAAALKSSPEEVEHRLVQVLESVKNLEKELTRLKSKLATSQGDDLADQAEALGEHKVLAASMDGADVRTLREAMDKLKDRLKSAAIVLGAVEGDKVTLIAGVTSDLTGRIKAGELVNFVAQQVGGRGGGRADMAQAGGTEPARLPDALKSVRAWVQQRV
jgi:alanyl-tRNA synthetase